MKVPNYHFIATNNEEILERFAKHPGTIPGTLGVR